MAALVKPTRHRRFRKKLKFQELKRITHNNNVTERQQYIINLSGKQLSLPQQTALAKRLNFAPNTTDEPETEEGITKLTRTIRLNHHFRNKEPGNSLSPLPPFKPRSTWCPPRATRTIEDYLTELPKSLATMPKRPYRSNLKKSERYAISTLYNDKTLTIKRADKGSCIVVENTSDYINNGRKHLSDTNIYTKRPDDPTINLAKGLNNYIKTIHTKGYIDNNMKNYLTNNDPESTRTQQLYFLKKIHKTPHGIRPIVSGSSGPTEKLSSFVDYFLQPLVATTTAYVRDTKFILEILEKETFPPDCTLATIDVTGLYLNIPHDEGISSTLHHLYHRNPDVDDIPFPPSVAKELLSTVLTQNYFEFDSEIFHQLRGTAMGTKMAPSYANLFMSSLEEKFQHTLNKKPLLWKRYIDDIILIWPGPPQEVSTMMDNLNKFHETIKFTSNISTESIDYLDITIFKGNRFEKEKKLDTKPHFKETNKFQYLHYDSSHPRSTFRGIVKGELTRVLRASSSLHLFKKNKQFLISMFKRRNYPDTILKAASNMLSYDDRTEKLKPSTPPTQKQPPPFIVRYSDQIPTSSIKTAIKTPDGETVPRICYRRNKNIADKLVRARVKGSKKPPVSTNNVTIKYQPSFKSHSAPCSTPLCRCCKLMSKKEVIYSTEGKPSKTQENTNCQSKGVIYLIECTLCTKKNMYVGQTSRTIRERIAGHRAVHGKKTMPLYHHLKKPNHSFNNISVTILEKIPNPSEERLLERENIWMTKLKTKLPQGLNSLYS